MKQYSLTLLSDLAVILVSEAESIGTGLGSAMVRLRRRRSRHISVAIMFVVPMGRKSVWGVIAIFEEVCAYVGKCE